jgi:putative endonuclease
MKTFWVYILKCSDNSYYTGMTSDLDGRIYEHEHGLLKGYTSKRRPVKLVWHEEFYDVWDAIGAERQIKGWRREKKEALINGRYDLLPKLSERYTPNKNYCHPEVPEGLNNF